MNFANILHGGNVKTRQLHHKIVPSCDDAPTYYSTLKDQPDLLSRLTNLDKKSFETLAGRVDLSLNHPVMLELRRGRHYSRKIGGGRNSKLQKEDITLMYLIYLNFQVTQEFLGDLFTLDDSVVSRTFARIEKIVSQLYVIPPVKKGSAKLPLKEIEALFSPLYAQNNALVYCGKSAYN